MKTYIFMALHHESQHCVICHFFTGKQEVVICWLLWALYTLKIHCRQTVKISSKSNMDDGARKANHMFCVWHLVADWTFMLRSYVTCSISSDGCWAARSRYQVVATGTHNHTLVATTGKDTYHTAYSIWLTPSPSLMTTLTFDPNTKYLISSWNVCYDYSSHTLAMQLLYSCCLHGNMVGNVLAFWQF